MIFTELYCQNTVTCVEAASGREDLNHDLQG